MLCGCRHLGSFVTYAPVKESLSFINNSVCVYTRYDIYSRDSIAVVDTCLWKYCPNANGYIILYKVDKGKMEVPSYIEDSNLDFVYNICPKWYAITQRELKDYADYKSPLHQDICMSLPLGLSSEERAYYQRHLNPTFADKCGNHRIVCDTIVNYGSFMLWFKRPLHPSLLYPMSKPLKTPNWIKKYGEEAMVEAMHEDFTNSYEFINYKVNQEKKVDFELDSIKGKQFSYIGEACKKESIRFVNDSICTHYLSTRDSVSSPFVPLTGDTCHYSVKNNLIAIDFEKDKPCDTLTYSNGIIFYSKVYKEGEKYTHIVKPFIDETRSCANKADSIDMIMSTYFNVYVPLNMYK